MANASKAVAAVPDVQNLESQATGLRGKSKQGGLRKSKSYSDRPRRDSRASAQSELSIETAILHDPTSAAGGGLVVSDPRSGSMGQQAPKRGGGQKKVGRPSLLFEEIQAHDNQYAFRKAKSQNYLVKPSPDSNPALVSTALVLNGDTHLIISRPDDGHIETDDHHQDPTYPSDYKMSVWCCDSLWHMNTTEWGHHQVDRSGRNHRRYFSRDRRPLCCKTSFKNIDTFRRHMRGKHGVHMQRWQQEVQIYHVVKAAQVPEATHMSYFETLDHPVVCCGANFTNVTPLETHLDNVHTMPDWYHRKDKALAMQQCRESYEACLQNVRSYLPENEHYTVKAYTLAEKEFLAAANGIINSWNQQASLEQRQVFEQELYDWRATEFKNFGWPNPASRLGDPQYGFQGPPQYFQPQQRMQLLNHQLMQPGGSGYPSHHQHAYQGPNFIQYPDNGRLHAQGQDHATQRGHSMPPQRNGCENQNFQHNKEQLPRQQIMPRIPTHQGPPVANFPEAFVNQIPGVMGYTSPQSQMPVPSNSIASPVDGIHNLHGSPIIAMSTPSQEGSPDTVISYQRMRENFPWPERKYETGMRAQKQTHNRSSKQRQNSFRSTPDRSNRFQYGMTQGPPPFHYAQNYTVSPFQAQNQWGSPNAPQYLGQQPVSQPPPGFLGSQSPFFYGPAQFHACAQFGSHIASTPLQQSYNAPPSAMHVVDANWVGFSGAEQEFVPSLSFGSPRTDSKSDSGDNSSASFETNPEQIHGPRTYS